jgi:hypothetical protein
VGKRFAYGFIGGWSVAALLMLLIWALTGKFNILSLALFGNTFGIWIVGWAERRGKVESIEQLHRPLTLFPRDHA